IIRPCIESLFSSPIEGGTLRIVINPAPDRGQLSSLQEALHILPPESQGFLFSPVDSPAVAETTVQSITRAYASRVLQERADAAYIVRPVFEGRRGHPVCASRVIAS